MSLRAELLLDRRHPSQLSDFGALVLSPPRRREFPDDDDRERLERMQTQLYEILLLYQSAHSPAAFRRVLGRGLIDLDHALKRCAWLAPRIDRALDLRAIHPDDRRERHCPACPWITGRIYDADCTYPDCALGHAA